MSESYRFYGDYTAFEKWEYKKIFYKSEQLQSWRDMGNSYFRACKPLIEGLAKGELNEDAEGTAAIYLFRHYLELMLKRIVLAGRVLANSQELQEKEKIKQVARVHDLRVIWKWVLEDAKPKIADVWDSYDIAFIEAMIKEFDDVDKKGFAFRYEGEGAEAYRYDFGALDALLHHTRQTLEGIWVCLEQTFQEICDYENYLTQEFGNEYGW